MLKYCIQVLVKVKFAHTIFYFAMVLNTSIPKGSTPPPRNNGFAPYTRVRAISCIFVCTCMVRCKILVCNFVPPNTLLQFMSTKYTLPRATEKVCTSTKLSYCYDNVVGAKQALILCFEYLTYELKTNCESQRTTDSRRVKNCVGPCNNLGRQRGKRPLTSFTLPVSTLTCVTFTTGECPTATFRQYHSSLGLFKMCHFFIMGRTSPKSDMIVINDPIQNYAYTYTYYNR